MNLCFVDRANAHSIWSLIDVISLELIRTGNTVTYCRLVDSSLGNTRAVPHGIKCHDIIVPKNKSALHLFAQSILFFLKFRKFVGKNNFDILHTNFVMPGAFARAIAYKKIPIIITTHHELFGSMSMHWRLILKFTQKFCDSAVYISDQVYGSFSDIKGFAKKDIVIKNGVDVKNLRNLALNSEKEEDIVKIICPGRLVNEKGQMLLIEAMPEILKQYPNAQLFLLGEGPDEWLLKQKSNLLRVSDSVFFLGWVAKKETMCHIANSDLMIVPSDGTQEGFGLVVAEAMALGTPLICSNIPVFREVADNTINYFSAGDHRELSKVAISCLMNKNQTKEIASNAYSRVNEFFDQNIMIDEYIKLYDKLVMSNLKNEI